MHHWCSGFLIFFVSLISLCFRHTWGHSICFGCFGCFDSQHRIWNEGYKQIQCQSCFPWSISFCFQKLDTRLWMNLMSLMIAKCEIFFQKLDIFMLCGSEFLQEWWCFLQVFLFGATNRLFNPNDTFCMIAVCWIDTGCNASIENGSFMNWQSSWGLNMSKSYTTNGMTISQWTIWILLRVH